MNIDLDRVIRKAGGRYSLVTLVQRRMRELQRGQAPLVARGDSSLDTVLEELREDKIWLATGEEAEKLRERRAAEASLRAPSAPDSAKPSGAGAQTTKAG